MYCKEEFAILIRDSASYNQRQLEGKFSSTPNIIYFVFSLKKKKKIYFKLSMEQKDIQHTYYKCLSSVSAAICHCVYFEMDGVYSPSFFFFFPQL